MPRLELPLAYPSLEGRTPLADGAVVLRGFAEPVSAALRVAIDAVARAAPFRHMVTPGRRRMSVAMTHCGALGWLSGPAGYRYSPTDPESGQPWPAMPPVFVELARDAAFAAGFPAFEPDACLINRYAPGARLSLHQDLDEADVAAPIVSVSLGVPAVFLFGGATRRAAVRRTRLEHGDVAVWGGPARHHFHGIAPLAESHHAFAGDLRLNLTFRRAR